MLTIICGEDSIASREYFFNLKQKYANEDYEIYNIIVNDLPEISKWLMESPSLFSEKRAYFIEYLNKKISKKNTPALFELIEKLIKKKDIEIIDWEEYTPARELKISKGIQIKEFKPPISIFKLLDSCYPSNLKGFLKILNALPIKIDEVFIFIMLCRHIRNLVTIKLGEPNKALQSWQLYKLKSQANYWKTDKLINFYEGLHRIDVLVKTSQNPFSLKKSLDLLACYFL